MKHFQYLLLFLCATQLTTSTEFNDYYFLQQQEYEIYQEKMQRFKDWLQGHNEQFTKHSCFEKCHKSCKFGIALASHFIQPDGNINACDLMIPRIHPTANHHKIFVKAMKKGVEFSPEMKNLYQESTNDSTNTDGENGYSDDAENEKLESNVADFAEHRVIQERKIKLVSNEEKNKKFYKELRSANQTAENIVEYRIIVTTHQEPKIKLYQKSPNTFKMDRIFAADKIYLEEHKIEHTCDQEEKITLYKKPSNTLKINRIFVAVKARVDVTVAKKKRAHAAKKTTTYKRAKKDFGNERESKKKIPLVAKQTFTQAVESKMEYIDNILRDAEALKPNEIKDRLKEYGFGAISRHWKKPQLVKKLSGLLNEKRDSLKNKLHIDQHKDDEKQVCRPIKLSTLGENMYLLQNGDLLHIAAAEKTFFAMDQAISQFMFKDKIYNLTNVCGRNMQYNASNPSHNLDIQFILSYGKIGTVTIQDIGDFVVVGGVPLNRMFVKINGKWHERKNVPVDEHQCLRTLFWSRENRKKFYRDNK